MEPEFTTEVMAQTRVRPASEASEKKAEYNDRPTPQPRADGDTPTKWMYASAGSEGERKPTRNPASGSDASDATKLVA